MSESTDNTSPNPTQESSTGVDTSISADKEKETYLRYKYLLILIADCIEGDKEKLSQWAQSKFGVVGDLATYDILLDLDKRNVISQSNLCVLKLFFEDNKRNDITEVIDYFLEGKYTLLRDHLLNIRQKRSKDAREKYLARDTSTEESNNVRSDSNSTLPQAEKHTTRDRDISEQQLPSTSGTQAIPPRILIKSPKELIEINQKPVSLVERPSSPNWSCEHYERLCYVKFECCEQFWPCHRCHNKESTCGERELKARHAIHIRCNHCNLRQKIAQKCSKCGIKFGEYFCEKCSHVTGKADKPYHCDKCGICRINGDRSFHCDVCGVCLDNVLKNNHSCREGSAHEGCCICHKDAFSGCKILSCSHKIHKECVKELFRRGITRCPLCKTDIAYNMLEKIRK